ncbi:type I restriction enzyme, S subunit, partial [Ignavigranum ruoffiae]
KDLVISYPKNIKEQKKIGEVSFSLNETITLHQQKLENLEKLKISLLQKMFV